jgi:hypothetical protein
LQNCYSPVRIRTPPVISLGFKEGFADFLAMNIGLNKSIQPLFRFYPERRDDKKNG